MTVTTKQSSQTLINKLEFDLKARYNLNIKVIGKTHWIVVSILDDDFSNIYVSYDYIYNYKKLYSCLCNEIEKQNKKRIFNKSVVKK